MLAQERMVITWWGHDYAWLWTRTYLAEETPARSWCCRVADNWEAFIFWEEVVPGQSPPITQRLRAYFVHARSSRNDIWKYRLSKNVCYTCTIYERSWEIRLLNVCFSDWEENEYTVSLSRTSMVGKGAYYGMVTFHFKYATGRKCLGIVCTAFSNPCM